jgi:hypothetical protein
MIKPKSSLYPTHCKVLHQEKNRHRKLACSKSLNPMILISVTSCEGLLIFWQSIKVGHPNHGNSRVWRSFILLSAHRHGGGPRPTLSICFLHSKSVQMIRKGPSRHTVQFLSSSLHKVSYTCWSKTQKVKNTQAIWELPYQDGWWDVGSFFIH